MKKCLIKGCDQDTRGRGGAADNYLCEAHWFALPLEMRKRWWDETTFGKKPPSPALRLLIARELRNKADH